ncbi:hypothetical protein ALC57_09022 [Trachymyrmex cornetzi]|uniref:GIY-YIG domain-containing protein n=1 Tax=Trachymyrmex cornetzi TaxID=471704 RepID=A0A151J611_9HYME|nr:hypothetical protein ALC57_09022 [Trachymyrmex cornetzi]
MRLEPREFLDRLPLPSLHNLKEKWFINLSGCIIPKKIQTVLQLGENFSVPSKNNIRVLIEFLKNIESNLFKIKPHKILGFRGIISPILHNFLSVSGLNNNISKRLNELISFTYRFLKNNKNIIFTKADKGNMTVALSKNDYISEVTRLLKDPETYIRIPKNPINTLTRKTRELLMVWKRKEFISDQTMRTNESRKVSDNSNEEPTNWFVLPYVPNLSEKFFSLVKKYNVKLAFFSFNKLKKFIRVQKDTLPKYFNKNVVYKIFCKDCDASYVGQTGRKLTTRISEHRNHINRNNNNQSVITNHRLEFNHEFDWDGVQILDKERILNKRLNSEMLHIHMQKNGLNLKTDTECLHYSYASLLDNFKQH